MTPGRQSAYDGRSSRRSLSRTRQSVPAAGSSRRSYRSLVLHQAECAGSRFFSCALVTPTPAVGADESRGRCGGSPGRRWPEGKGKRGGKGKTERRRLKTKKKERQKVLGLIVKGRSGEVSRSELTSPRPSRWPGRRPFYRGTGARKPPNYKAKIILSRCPANAGDVCGHPRLISTLPSSAASCARYLWAERVAVG